MPQCALRPRALVSHGLMEVTTTQRLQALLEGISPVQQQLLERLYGKEFEAFVAHIVKCVSIAVAVVGLWGRREMAARDGMWGCPLFK
jgi:hypothetical protein